MGNTDSGPPGEEDYEGEVAEVGKSTLTRTFSYVGVEEVGLKGIRPDMKKTRLYKAQTSNLSMIPEKCVPDMCPM